MIASHPHDEPETDADGNGGVREVPLERLAA